MTALLLLVILALLVETIVDTLKLVWDVEKRKISWPTIVSLIVGIAVAFVTQANFFEMLGITIVASSWLAILITGILISRGANFIYDLWKRINLFKEPLAVSEIRTAEPEKFTDTKG